MMFTEAIKARRRQGAQTILFDFSSGRMGLVNDAQVNGKNQFALYVGRGAGSSETLSAIAATRYSVLFNHDWKVRV